MLAPLFFVLLLVLLVLAAPLLHNRPAAGKYRSLTAAASTASANVPDSSSHDDARERLRTQLLEMCDQYKQQQRSAEGGTVVEVQRPGGRNGEPVKVPVTRGGLFGAGSLAADTLVADERSAEILRLVDELVVLNPTPFPLQGWAKGMRDDGYAPCPLDGDWCLRYTNAADATFKRSRRGDTVTSQNVNATTSLITNRIRFPHNKGKVIGFDVVVSARTVDNDGGGVAAAAARLLLDFRRVVVYRRSRFPLLFGRISVPLPRFNILRRLTRSAGSQSGSGGGSSEGPSLEVLYLDDDVRVHRTDAGNVFVQSRLYQLWDPAAPGGWTLQSFV